MRSHSFFFLFFSKWWFGSGQHIHYQVWRQSFRTCKSRKLTMRNAFKVKFKGKTSGLGQNNWYCFTVKLTMVLLLSSLAFPLPRPINVLIISSLGLFVSAFTSNLLLFESTIPQLTQPLSASRSQSSTRGQKWDFWIVKRRMLGAEQRLLFNELNSKEDGSLERSRCVFVGEVNQRRFAVCVSVRAQSVHSWVNICRS